MSCCRILGPAVYVFLASVVPALAFGVQIDEATGQRPGAYISNFTRLKHNVTALKFYNTAVALFQAAPWAAAPTNRIASATMEA